MVRRQQPGHDVLRLDRGSAIVEGAIALGIAFVLLGLVVQLAFLVEARAVAQAAVDAHAHRVAVAPSTGGDALVGEITRSLPGARDVVAAVSTSDEWASTTLEFTWDPPGPRFVPVVVTVRGHAPVIAPP